MHREEFVAVIRTHPGVKYNVLAGLCGATEATVAGHLHRLANEGVIARTRDGRWRIADDDEEEFDDDEADEARGEPDSADPRRPWVRCVNLYLRIAAASSRRLVTVSRASAKAGVWKRAGRRACRPLGAPPLSSPAGLLALCAGASPGARALRGMGVETRKFRKTCTPGARAQAALTAGRGDGVFQIVMEV
jgi:hypothetical protein